jgi:hypothetical protein
MGQVQSQPPVQQPWSIWSIFSPQPQPYHDPVLYPGQYGSTVFTTQPAYATQGVVVQKVPNVKPINTTNKNKNKNKNKAAAQVVLPNIETPVVVPNVQPTASNSSQAIVPIGGKQGKKKTRRNNKH